MVSIKSEERIDGHWARNPLTIVVLGSHIHFFCREHET
jgi:hypothetical protein